MTLKLITRTVLLKSLMPALAMGLGVLLMFIGAFAPLLLVNLPVPIDLYLLGFGLIAVGLVSFWAMLPILLLLVRQAEAPDMDATKTRLALMVYTGIVILGGLRLAWQAVVALLTL